MSPHKSARDLIPASLGFLTTATFAVLIQLLQPGWPDNHEGNSFFTRTALYSEHFKLLDLLPIWSSIDNAGMGSPQPLLYHKSFYYLSGSLYALTDSLKFSVGLAIVLLLAIGATGVFLLLRRLEVGRLTATAGGLFFQFASYTTTVWLYRGAVAEFAFACLLPWFLLSCLSLLRVPTDLKVRTRLTFGALLALLFYSHSSCTLATLVLLTPALAITIIDSTEPKAIRNQITNFAVGGLFGITLIAPFLIPMLVIGSRFGTSRIAPPYLLPKNQMRPWFEYIIDSKFSWGKEFPTFTISLDKGVIFLALLTILVLLKQPSILGKFFNNYHSSQNQRMLRFLCLILLFTILSQLPLFSFIYLFPGLNFLQFPWRLLTLITPLIIVVSIKVVSHYEPFQTRKLAGVLTGLCLVATVATGGGLIGTKWERINIQPTELTDLHFSFSLFGEYFPKAVNELPYQSAVLQTNEPDCIVARIGPTSESLRWVFKVDCTESRPVVLPVISSDYHVIDLVSDTKHLKQRCSNSNYLCTVVVPIGSTYLFVRPPTLLGFWTSFL